MDRKILEATTKEIKAWFERIDPETTQARDGLKKAAKIIWHRQTIKEQNTGRTLDLNGMGFNRYDAEFATRIVNWKGPITPFMALGARKMLKKYSKQIAIDKLDKLNP